MYIANNVLEYHLRNVYFVGGAACGGKSTLAKALAKKYGYYHYNADETIKEHYNIANKVYQPAMTRRHFIDLETYFGRPIDDYTKFLLDTTAESFEMMLMDLVKLNSDKPVIAEGVFSACAIKSITTYNRAILLFAEADLVKRDYFNREDKQSMLNAIKKLKNPDKSLEHILNVIANVSNIQYQDAKRSGLKCLTRNNQSTVEKTLAEVEKHFFSDVEY